MPDADRINTRLMVDIDFEGQQAQHFIDGFSDASDSTLSPRPNGGADQVSRGYTRRLESPFNS